MARSYELLKFLDNYNYTVSMAPTEASRHNYPVERTHRYIGEVVKILMKGHDTPLQLWYIPSATKSRLIKCSHKETK